MTLSSLIAHQIGATITHRRALFKAARRVNRRATTRHPESSGEAASEGSGTGRVVAPDPYHSCAGDQLGALASLL